MLHVSIKPEVLFTYLGVPVTNSLIASLIVTVLFLVAGLYFYNNFDSDSKFVFFVRFILIKLEETFEPIVGKLFHSVFPFIASLFLFILLSNWMGLLPGFGSITIALDHGSESHETESIESHDDVASDTHLDDAIDHEDDDHGHEVVEEEDGTVAVEHLTDEDSEGAMVGETTDTDSHGEAAGEHAEEEHHAPTPIFRGATADLNMTLILAIMAFFVIQYYGFRELGLGYLKKFFNFKDPIYFFAGILELISEFSKVISFAFRLFGNIFAGEVLLAVVAFLVPVLASFPFLLLEVFVGFIQAVVFAMLVAVFISSAVTAEH